MPRSRRIETHPEEIIQQFYDEVPSPVEEIRIALDPAMDLQPTIFNDSNWRIINETQVLEGSPIPSPNMVIEAINDMWGTAENNRRQVAEETQRLVNEMIVEDLSTVELADEGRSVVQANRDTRARRVYSVDEASIEVGVPVPANVDRRCVVRADRKQGIESVKTE